MKPCTIPAEPSWLWMAGLGGLILGLALAAVQREVERRRKPQG